MYIYFIYTYIYIYIYIYTYIYTHASVLPITGIPHVGWREEVGAHDSGWILGRVKGTNFTGLVCWGKILTGNHGFYHEI